MCDKTAFCYSLSPVRRVFLKKEALQVNDGEFRSHTRYEKIQRGDFAYQLNVQLEVPPNFTTPAGEHPLGITLYDKRAISEVTLSTCDSSAKVVESTVLSKEFHAVATFQFRRSSEIKSLHFEVKAASGVIGRAVVLTSQLSSSHHGVVVIPLLDSSFVVLGEVAYRYLVVTPFSHPHIAHTALPQARMALPTPRSSNTLLVGHRGTGSEGSRKVVDGKVCQ